MTEQLDIWDKNNQLKKEIKKLKEEIKELKLSIFKSKNYKIIQENTKLQQDKANLTKQINELKRELGLREFIKGFFDYMDKRFGKGWDFKLKSKLEEEK